MNPSTFNCYDCDRSFASRYSLKTHLLSSIHALDYYCNKCDRSFIDQHSLDQHLDSPIHASEYSWSDDSDDHNDLDDHPNLPVHVPKYSSDWWDEDSLDLDHHLSSPIHTTDYHYNECGRDFLDQALGDQFSSPIHTQKHGYSEYIKCLTSQKALNHTELSKYGPKHHCDECNRDFINKLALSQHLRSSIHMPGHHCKKGFSNRKALDNHVKYRCNECDKCFINQQVLDQHSSSSAHITNPHCKKCDKYFVDQYALDQHVVSPAHKLKFYCHECDRGFSTHGVLKQHHMATHARVTQHSIGTPPGHCSSLYTKSFSVGDSLEMQLYVHSFLGSIGLKGRCTVQTNDKDIVESLKKSRDEYAKLHGCRPVSLEEWARDRVGDETRDSFYLVKPEKKRGEKGYLWKVIDA